MNQGGERSAAGIGGNAARALRRMAVKRCGRLRWLAATIVFLLGLIMVPVTQGVAAAAITGVKAGRFEGYDRFVVQVTQPPSYDLFTLDRPYRLVLDFRDADWAVASNAMPGMRRMSALRALRYSRDHRDRTRLALDLQAPVRLVREFILSPGEDSPFYRLVLDMAPADSYQPITPGSHQPATPSPVPPDVSPGNIHTAALAAKNTFAEAGKEAVREKEEGAVVPAESVSAISAAPAEPAMLVPPTGAAKTPAFVPVPQTKPARARKPVIVIDAGHGGVDPGAIGYSRTHEKYITLTYARALHDALQSTGRYQPVLTRSNDKILKLRERIAKARKAGGDLFISLHADSARQDDARGLSVYTLSEVASDKEAAYLATQENKVDILAGLDLSDQEPDVTEILIDLAQRDTNNKSSVFAEMLVKELGRSVRLLRNPHRFAGFVVLKAPDIPSVLVEIGFLSNRDDEKLLQSASYRKRVNDGIIHAIDAYFKKYGAD